MKELDAAPDPVVRGTTSELLTYRALAEAARGAPATALDIVDRAEDLSRAHEAKVLTSFVRAICALTERRTAGPLLEAAVDATVQSGYVDRLITAYRAVPSLMNEIAANPACGPP